MPKVTQLQTQVKRANRYSIHIDGKYAFSLSANDLIATGLHSGQELTEAEVERYRKLSLESKAVDRVYNFLSYRQRTEKEVRDYLRKKGYEDEFGDQVVDKLKRQGMISDQQFAVSWVGSRQSLRPRSRRRLEQELRQKGVSTELIAETLAAVSDEDEVAAIQEIATKKLSQAKYRDQPTLVKYLASQGFSYDLIKRALEELET